MSNTIINTKLSDVIRNGGVGVIPTDTLYALAGSAFSKRAVERIYELKHRDKKKPFIVLVYDVVDLEKFGAILPRGFAEKAHKLWKEEPTSIILPLTKTKMVEFEYLHRGTGEMAFRIPKSEICLAFLEDFGPLVAPSANLEGEKPAETMEEAKACFGDNVDFYVDGGRLSGMASRLIRLNEIGEVLVLRR
ncbi:MAG: L-threonylcarbamoyladenylate synthase [bacterium]|nr:L-threonylcarbamoyladenylate synthase [bacterium]